MKADVLIVIPSFYPAVIYGGPIVSTYKTCLALNDRGVDFSVCTTNANGNTKLKLIKNKPVHDLGFAVKYYNETFVGKFSLRLLLNLWFDILTSKVIHIQSIFSTPVPIALFYSWLFRKNIVLSPRGSLGAWCLNQKNITKKIWINLFIRPFLKRVVWHATSEQEKNEIISLFKGGEVSIIPNGIDLNLFSKYKANKSYFIDKYHLSSSTSVVVSMGRIEKKKGFDILLHAIKFILDLGHDIHVFIAGPDYGELHNLTLLAQDLKISDKVSFVGNIDGTDKLDFLGAADVFAMPSHNENFGNVYAEALACGTPIIASKNTPWHEVEVFDCGRWVDNNYVDTAEAIVDILNKNSSVLQANCINYISQFAWDSVASEFQKLYQRMM